MNIYTVRDNLKKTIAGKETAIKMYRELLENLDRVEGVGAQAKRQAYFATVEFLDINLIELRAILADVEQCVAKDVEQSWRDNPDRMGGQFTQDEIDNAERW